MKNIEKMREAVKSVYPNASWRIKVSKMNDSQILAIYRRFQETKKL